MASRRAAHLVAETLGIDVNARYAREPPDLDRRAQRILDPGEIYAEEEPGVADFFREQVPDRAATAYYVRSLFPSAHWLRRYCLDWLAGDIVAGITIGLVVVPQAMAYASLAQLSPGFGLYTSFTGACLYWLFGTSKDIVIGATAVGSLLVGQVVDDVTEAAPDEYSPMEIAHALSLMSGIVMLFFGLFRLGWVIEFVPYIPISAFITAASITIMCTQIPVALGIAGIDRSEAPYLVIYNTLLRLPEMHIDAVIGISCIILLFTIRGFCSRMEARHASQKRMWAFISSLRLAFAVLLYTLISFFVNRQRSEDDAVFNIVGTIQPGFDYAAVPHVDRRLVRLILPQLPAIAIILIVEHIAISKSMGRLYNYTVNPSQEIVALGSANVLSPFVGGYVCTGSFGASAVLSKAGVRTPLAGVFSALVLLLALYVFTAAFYFIPKAALGGLIIHAVCNLLTPPKNLFKYWQLSPVELVIWVIGVASAIFDSLETSIYSGIILSVLVLLCRGARTRGRFLGRVRVSPVGGKTPSRDDQFFGGMYNSIDGGTEVFLPLDRRDASNQSISVQSPYPGVFVYRFSENYNYTNQAYHVETLSEHITHHTIRTSDEYYEKESDRLWCDPAAKTYQYDAPGLPYLRAIVLDFAAVNNMDVTSVQGLVDLRNAFDRYVSPDAVEWHFANVHNRWTRRALAVAGFGYPTSQNSEALAHWKPVYSIAPVLADETSVSDEESRSMPAVSEEPGRSQTRKGRAPDLPADEPLELVCTPQLEAPRRSNMAVVSGVNRPFFHMDLHGAVQAAVRDAESKDAKMEF